MNIEDVKKVRDLTKIERKMAHDSSFQNHTIGVWELNKDKKSLKKLVRMLILPRVNWTNFTGVPETLASYVYYNFNLQKVKLSHLAPIDESEVSPDKTLDQVEEVKRKQVENK